ncbi:hypothetical protein KQI91_03785 [Blautia sp. MSJ-19]|nr:hypothetical protein [Blautia sp. MSJ-19]
MLLSAIAAASIIMTGCGFSPDDSGDSQAVTISPEPAEATSTPAPTTTPAPTVTPAASLTTTPAPATANGTSASTDGTTTDGTSTSADGSTSGDTTSASDASTGSDDSSSASGNSSSSGDASAYVGSTLNDFMSVYGTPIEYEPAYDADGNEVGGVYSFNDFSITTDFMSGSETVEAVDYY